MGAVVRSPPRRFCGRRISEKSVRVMRLTVKHEGGEVVLPSMVCLVLLTTRYVGRSVFYR